MIDQLITKDTAILAKSKGCDLSSNYFYTAENGLCEIGYDGETLYTLDKHLCCIDYIYDCNGEFWFDTKDQPYFPEKYPALTQSLLQRWLREVYNLYVVCTSEFYGDGINHNVQVLCYNPNLSGSDYYDNSKCTGMFGDNGEFETYGEALEFGLQKALELI